MSDKHFREVFDKYTWQGVLDSVRNKTAQDVERALYRKGRRDIDDFAAMISPAAQNYIEEMAQLSQQATRKRYGKTLQLYAPLYLSNECINNCSYCGFSSDNKITRRTLNPAEIDAEVKILKEMKIDHVLLVTGEAGHRVGMPYFRKVMEQLRGKFANISMEVQPLKEEEYRELGTLGLHAVMVYQETYNEANYLDYHHKGPKRDFDWRLDTPDRLGKAGIHKVGIGALYGLEDWLAETFFVGLHLKYLENTYWRTRYSISFPRLRPNVGGHPLKSVMSDKDLVQVLCAFRLLSEEVELSVSTRESPLFRDHVARFAATTMSAGSMTNPGGYSEGRESLEQFEIHDDRSADEMADMLRSIGLEPVWKDWGSEFSLANH